MLTAQIAGKNFSELSLVVIINKYLYGANHAKKKLNLIKRANRAIVFN